MNFIILKKVQIISFRGALFIQSFPSLFPEDRFFRKVFSFLRLSGYLPKKR